MRIVSVFLRGKREKTDMLYGIYLSASGMALNQHRLDVVANNLANVNTTGFKRDLAVFKQREQQAVSSSKGSNFLIGNMKFMTGGPFVASRHTDFTPSSVENTGRNLDIAIEGKGFLLVKDQKETRLSRDGRLSVSNGVLARQSDGKPVLDENGQTIQLDNVLINDIRIDSEGNLWANGSQKAKIAIVDVDNPNNLRKAGGGFFDASGEKYHSVNTPIISGAVESSSVNPSSELVEMIKTTHSFELNAQMLSMQNETLGRLVNELTRV